jgi:hypothetical protein
MSVILIALQIVQVPPAVTQRPAFNAPATKSVSPAVRKQKVQSDARALLARAEAVQGNYAPAAGQPPKAELDNQIEQIKNDLDNMSEMGEMESLRLQMAMDRMSKMMSTLSNLLKKISDTSQSITQNIK